MSDYRLKTLGLITLLISLLFAAQAAADEVSDVDIGWESGLSELQTFEILDASGGLLDSASFAVSSDPCKDALTIVNKLKEGGTPEGVTVTDTTWEAGFCGAWTAGSLRIRSSAHLELTACLGGGPCTYPDDVIPPPPTGRTVGRLTYYRSTSLVRRSLPALSQWGRVALGTAMLTATAWALRRQRAA